MNSRFPSLMVACTRAGVIAIAVLSVGACRTRLDDGQARDSPAGPAAADSVVPPDASTPPDLFSIHPVWPMHGGDAGHRYRSRLPGPAVPHLKWSFKTQGPPCFLCSSPVIAADGTVYAPSGGTVLHALDGERGTERWSFSAGGVLRSTPAIGEDGTVYVHASDHTVYALDGATGALRWSRTIGNAPASGQPYAPAPILGADGTVYLSAADGSALSALEPASGAVKWLHPIAGSDRLSFPTVSESGTILVTAIGPGAIGRAVTVHAIDPGGGSRWSLPIKGYSVPHASDRGRYFFGDGDGFQALDDASGTRSWMVPGVRLFVPALFAADGTIYANYDEQPATAVVDSTSGAVQRTVTRINVCWPAAMVLDSEGTIYSSGCNFWLQAHDAVTGALKWDFQVADGHVVASPIVGSNNTLIITSSDGYVFAVGP